MRLFSNRRTSRKRGSGIAGRRFTKFRAICKKKSILKTWRQKFDAIRLAIIRKCFGFVMGLSSWEKKKNFDEVVVVTFIEVWRNLKKRIVCARYVKWWVVFFKIKWWNFCHAVIKTNLFFDYPKSIQNVQRSKFTIISNWISKAKKEFWKSQNNGFNAKMLSRKEFFYFKS